MTASVYIYTHTRTYAGKREREQSETCSSKSLTIFQKGRSTKAEFHMLLFLVCRYFSDFAYRCLGNKAVIVSLMKLGRRKIIRFSSWQAVGSRHEPSWLDMDMLIGSW